MIVKELKGLQDVQSISYKRHLSMLEVRNQLAHSGLYYEYDNVDIGGFLILSL